MAPAPLVHPGLRVGEGRSSTIPAELSVLPKGCRQCPRSQTTRPTRWSYCCCWALKTPRQATRRAGREVARARAVQPDASSNPPTDIVSSVPEKKNPELPAAASQFLYGLREAVLGSPSDDVIKGRRKNRASSQAGHDFERHNRRLK